MWTNWGADTTVQLLSKLLSLKRVQQKQFSSSKAYLKGFTGKGEEKKDPKMMCNLSYFELFFPFELLLPYWSSDQWFEELMVIWTSLT